MCEMTISGRDPFNFELQAPIDRWDEALPLGNGLMGGLLWGGGNEIRLSLDRGDLWDLREHPDFTDESFTYETVKSMVEEGRIDELNVMCGSKNPLPTKLPGARLVMTLGREVRSFSLDMKKALGLVSLGNGKVECLFCATHPIAMLRLPEPCHHVEIIPNEAVGELGYKPAEIKADGAARWLVQDASLDLRYVVYCETRNVEGGSLFVVTMATSGDGRDPLVLARERAHEALEKGYQFYLSRHLQWWSGFWARSSVMVPDDQVQQHYNLVQYMYGSASRRGAPPIPLQGVWTADEGNLPPWHGDYHHDLNTQLTYWAYLTSGRFEQGISFLDFMWSHWHRHREFAEGFFGLSDGHVVPGVMSLDGGPMGGWIQYTLSPTMGVWVAQAFHWHWLYTMDSTFLAERAYPYCAGIARSLVELMKPDPGTGMLKLPLSSSPEIHNNSQKAWLTPNSNFDLSLIRWLLSANAQMATALSRSSEAFEWKGLLGRMEELAVEEGTGLRLSPDESLTESHRHHSHLMAIHPLGLVHVEGGEGHRGMIRESLETIEKLGTLAWVGYSFSWMACIYARIGDGDGALRYLHDFITSFTLRNGFHCNGEQTRRGLSDYHYRPFTLEGNFAAGQAVHEMLLQGWGGRIRVFPAVPTKWEDVSFKDLRGEGGYIVSATRRRGRTIRVMVKATVDGMLRIKNPFGREEFKCDVEMEIVGDELRCPMSAGQSINLTSGSANL